MRIAVISDIHGNCVALDAVLADIATHPVDSWVCLGDVVQGGPQPAQVVERMRDLACPIVVGNTDSFITKGSASSGEELTGDLMAVRNWTVSELGPEGMQFLETFVPTVEIELPAGRRQLCFHGSPRSFDDVLLPETRADELRAALGRNDATLQCGGHTHLQWTTTIGKTRFFNPGSIGVVYNRHVSRENFCFSPWAEFAIVETDPERDRIEFCKVRFDVDELEKATLQSGHPFAERQAALYRCP